MAEKRVKQMFEEDNFSIYSEKIESGLSKFREEHKDQPNADIVRCVKRVIFGDKKGIENENLNVLVETFKEIVKICNLTVQEYDNYWSVEVNKKMFLENISRKITALASDADKEECAFQRKRLLFKIVYPEYYKEHFSEIKPYDLFHIGGENKASLVRAAKPLVNKEEKENAEVISDGAIVDKLMMKTLNTAFKIAGGIYLDKNGELDKIEVMKALTDIKKIKGLVNASSGQKATVPGCFSVISERKCYESYLDFYFLNLPKEEQIFLVDDYMEIRKKAKIEPNPLLDKFYEIFQENRDEFVDSLYI